MKLNGHLEFLTPTGAGSDGQIKNAIIERVASNPGTGNVAGRIVYNTGDNLYYYHNGTEWTPFSTGGDASALLAEVNAIEAALGTGLVNTDGTYVDLSASMTTADGAGSLAEIITQMDTYISGHDQLSELNDVKLTSIGSGEILKWSGSAWINNTLAEAGIQPADTTLDSLAALSGTGILTQTAADTFVYRSIDASVVSGDQGISIVNGSGVSGNPTVGLDITGLTAEAGTPSGTDTLAMYDGADNVKVSITQLANAIVATNTVSLGDLSDVTDSLTSSLVTDDKYFFNATAADAYEVTSATLGGLNNVADAVDSASNEDILAFDGSAWTAITVSTMLADGSLADLSDVTVTTPTAGQVLQYSTGSPSIWENVNIGAASGIQPYDAGLEALATGGTGIVSMSGDNVYFSELTGTAGNIVITNGDGTGGNPTFNLGTVSDSNTGTFYKVTVDGYGRVTGTEAVGASDITGLVDSTYVNVSGDTMTGNLIMTTGYKITLPDQPALATDAVNKSYVDALVTAGAVWVQPIRNPDFVGVAQAEPASPLASGMYIASGGVGYPQTWTGSVSVAEGDMMHYTGGVWENSGSLTVGHNLLVGVFTNAVDNDSGEDIPTGLYQDDYVRYLGTDPDDVANWDFPYGRSGLHPGWSATSTAPSTITIAGSDETASIKVGNSVTYDGNTYTVQNVTFSTDTVITTAEATVASTTGTVKAELTDGITTLTSNPADSHYGQSYLYSATDDEWVQVSGPGTLDAGVGLAYSGTTLNVQLGAGIKELPSDEVGLDVESGKAVQLTSELTGGLLTFVLDGTTLSQSASGLKVDAGGITATELNTSVAGAGLSGGAGTALAVNVDDSTIEINVDTLRVKDNGITNAKLADSDITITGDSGSDAVALGETLTVSGTDPINTSMVANVLTISAANATTTTKGVASFSSDNFAVSAGAVTIKDGGVANAELVNSTITFAGDSGSSAIALGGTHTIAGGTLTTATHSGGTTTIDVEVSMADLSDVTISGGGSPDGLAAGDVIMSVNGTSYVNKQIQYIEGFTSATTWVVTHNLGQKYVNVTVVDSNDQVIIPQSITMDSATQTTVTFNTAIAGTAIIMGVPGVAVN